MNDKDVWLYGKWPYKELSNTINKMNHGDKLYINLPRTNGKSVFKWITTSMIEHKLNGIDISTENYMEKNMEEQLKLQDELKERAEITVRGMIKMLPPDVQTIVYNAERLDGEKEWYKWRLEYARELLEKSEVMKAKELLNQTDVDFRCFSELWEKAHANR